MSMALNLMPTTPLMWKPKMECQGWAALAMPAPQSASAWGMQSHCQACL
uniref:Alternative protein EPHA1 n=1 Tax=Homo sapiens TaxID=9606 RepID=L8EAE3_HUMAN|nr:alternative protein EPHA1 [Homo sapiens]